MKLYTHNNIDIYIHDNGRVTVLPKGTRIDKLPPSGRPPFKIKADGWKMIGLSQSGFVLESVKETQSGITLVYVSQSYGLRVDTELYFVPDTSVIVQTNKVENISDKIVKLTRFSSAFIENIAHDPDLAWYDNDSLKINICHNKWQGEAQWQSFKPYEIGLYPTTTHSWERASFKIGTIGSWSTANFYPLTVIEDAVHGVSWFMETEGSHNWNIKYTAWGGYNAGSLSVEAVSADENNGAWFYDLVPGETYTAERAFWGIAEGGFEAAAGELVKFKRLDATARFGEDIPVIFNVYMDCIWGMPTPEKLMPLIERASEVGCEYFVIDGGWCKTAKAEKGLGDWLPRDMYNEMPLDEIVRKINEKGMVAGIWTELDAVNSSAYGYTLGEDALLYRYDSIIGGERAFYNFENEAVRAYLADRIDALYNAGFRYIKNDYNQSTGIGSDNNANASPAEGNIVNANAFCSFIDEMREKYPDLVIENCGSGALRDDNKALRRFEVQSTSDQELYLNNVSIVSGSMTLIPPEKAGVWAYPYPAHFEVYEDFAPDSEYVKEMADGRETVFNLVNAMCAVPFLSGRIDLCDEYNLELVQKGVEQYKKIRKYIGQSLPVYPCGNCRINDKRNYAYGLLSDKRLLLCVWNVNSDEMHFEIDLSKYMNDGRVVSSYFAKNTLEYDLSKNKMTVDFKAKKTAAFFEIEI